MGLDGRDSGHTITLDNGRGESRKTPAGQKHPLAQSYEKSNLTVLVMFCMVSSYLKNVVGP